MSSKIIPFTDKYFEITKQPPLSLLMVETLRAACAKQTQGIAFGPGDIKGSCIALVKRGLIINKEVIINKHTESRWQVTNEAIQMLEKLGIEIPC